MRSRRRMPGAHGAGALSRYPAGRLKSALFRTMEAASLPIASLSAHSISTIDLICSGLLPDGGLGICPVRSSLLLPDSCASVAGQMTAGSPAEGRNNNKMG